MNQLNPFGPLGRSARRRRLACLFVEAMESRLVLSPTLPLPPPHGSSMVAYFPTGPIFLTGPCTREVWNNFPSGPCNGQVWSNIPSGPGSISR
jgi:hypothetical protein